jgi:hypothetical protein
MTFMLSGIQKPFCDECRYAECRYAECHNAECRYAECRYAECRNAECHYSECRSAKTCWLHCLIVTAFLLSISHRNTKLVTEKVFGY